MLNQTPQNVLSLYSHQKVALDKARPFDSYALFMETGTGKTLVALSLIEERKEKTLVVCPMGIINDVWVGPDSDTQKFFPKLKALNLWEVLRKKQPIPSGYDLYVINFESVRRLSKEFLDSIGMLVLDESSKIKNPKAAITKFILKYSGSVKNRLAMSGTPAPNSLLEYWSQMFFVNPSILGKNYYIYRARNFFSVGFGNFLWKPRKEFKEGIGKILSAQSYSVQKKDSLDLPEKVFMARKFILEPVAASAYRQMVLDNIILMSGKTVLGANELAKIMKLRQITSGFVMDTDGKPLFISNAKTNLLKDALEEIGDKQVIIWCQFVNEIERLKEIYGAKASYLYGGTPTGDRDGEISKFKTGKTQYLIAHPRSAGHGLNFTNASFCVYFSISYSFEEEKQSQDRLHRIGQTNKVSYIYLQAENTIDEVIYKALRSKERMSDAVLQMINKYG